MYASDHETRFTLSFLSKERKGDTSLESYKRERCPQSPLARKDNPCPRMSQLSLLLDAIDSDSEGSVLSAAEEEEVPLLKEVLGTTGTDFHATYVFLTFSKCPLLQEIITGLCSKYKIEKAIGSFELHGQSDYNIDEEWAPTGEWPHSHWCIQFKKKTKVRASDGFDIDGYHPNVRIISNWVRTVRYCKKKIKDGKIQLECVYYNCDEKSIEDHGRAKKRSAPEPIDNLYDAARTLRGQPEAYWELCRKSRENPIYCRIAWDSVNHTADIASPVVEFRDSTPGTRAYARLSPYLQSMSYDHNLPFVLIICGPSQCGKSRWGHTELANNPATNPYLLVDTKDALKDGFSNKQFKSDYKAIILDEFDVTGGKRSEFEWDIKNQIKLVDFESNHRIRCRWGDAYIPKGIHKIWTCTNTWPITRDYQIARRCRFINLYYGKDPESMWTRTNPDDTEDWNLEDEGFMIDLPDV